MSSTASAIELITTMELDLGSPAGQFRAAPLQLGDDHAAFVAIYAADFDVDPYHEMFFYPTDTPKMLVFDAAGKLLWRRDLGRGVVPGMWFLPFYPFDLDGDGVDEIYFVNNLDEKHPLGVSSYVLERVDARTGATTGRWPWPQPGEQAPSHMFRNFIFGGYVQDRPVLVTAIGTYGPMRLTGYGPGLEQLWDTRIGRDTPGARGSHMCPVLDLNNDGVDEVLWGERCIELAGGRELFCADRDVYRGHSDVIHPVRDRARDRWLIYTCRESDNAARPRVVMFDDAGQRVWGDVDHGHMDMGWVARVGPERQQVAMAIRIGKKTCGPDGRFHQDMTEFTWDALTGTPVKLPFSVYRTVPVDLNGDGAHEFVRGIPSGNGDVLDGAGQVIGNVHGTVALAGRLIDHPGEQMLSYTPEGRVRLWADARAQDSDFTRAVHRDRFYRAALKLAPSGSNMYAMTGL